MNVGLHLQRGAILGRGEMMEITHLMNDIQREKRHAIKIRRGIDETIRKLKNEKTKHEM